MDVLSDVVTTLRGGRPHSARTERQGPWAVSHPRFDGAGFHVVLQGSCWLDTGAVDPVAVAVGDVVFLPRGAAHALRSAPDAVPVTAAPLSMVAPVSAEEPGVVMLCGAYRFDPTLTHPVLHTLPEVIHLRTRLGRHRALRTAVELLADELARPRPGADAILPSMLDVLLLYVVRAWYEQQDEDVPWAAALRDPIVHTALQALHEAPATAWTVESLGRRVGLSRAAFARRFAEVVGEPPLTYLTRWRLTLAATLLREQPDAPLAAVGRRVGYSSEYAFGAAFKRAHGVAPGRYRAAGPPSGDLTAATGSRAG